MAAIFFNEICLINIVYVANVVFLALQRHIIINPKKTIVAISKELKVGLLTVVAGSILYWGFNFLKGVDFLSPTRTYYAVFDKTEGLTVSNQITINGFPVGRVDAIRLDQSTAKNKLIVTLAINKEIAVGDESQIVLADDGLLGGKLLKLNLLTKKGNIAEGDTIPSQIEGGITSIIYDKVVPITGKVDSAVSIVNGLLLEYKGMSKDIEGVIKNVNQTTLTLNATMNDNRQNITKVTKNMADLTQSLVDTEKQLRPIIAKMNSLADSLNSVEFAALANNANQLLAELEKTTKAINNGQGTVGLMLKTDSIHNNLNKTMLDLDAILVDFKERPKRYIPNISVFGKKDKEEKADKKAGKK